MSDAERVPEHVLFGILVSSRTLLPLAELCLAQEAAALRLAEEVFALAGEGLGWFCAKKTEQGAKAVRLWKKLVETRSAVFCAAEKDDVQAAAEGLSGAKERIAAGKEAPPSRYMGPEEEDRQKAWAELRGGLEALAEFGSVSAFCEEFRAFAENLAHDEGDLAGLPKYVALIGLSWVLPGSSLEVGAEPFNPVCYGKAKAAAGRLDLDLASELDEARHAAFQGGALEDRAAKYMDLLYVARDATKGRDETEAPGAEAAEVPERAPEQGPPNIYRHVGGGWSIASKEVGGGEVFLPDCKGASYIAALLHRAGSHPESPGVSCGDLERRETLRRNPPDNKAQFIDAPRGESAPDESGEGSSGGAAPGDIGVNPHLGDLRLDPQAASEYEQCLEEIKSELEAAEANNDQGRIAPLEEKKQWLAHELQQHFDRRGRPRVTGSPQENSRRRVSDRINSARESIKPHNEKLYQHFYNKIQTGRTCKYTGDKKWDVRF